mgnify:CR=1 FL=1
MMANLICYGSYVVLLVFELKPWITHNMVCVCMVTPLEFNSFQVCTQYLCISHILSSYIVTPYFFGCFSVYASVVSSHIVSVSTYVA